MKTGRTPLLSTLQRLAVSLPHWFSAQLDLAPEQAYWLDWGFVGLFAALALMGLVTVLQLARLRASWFGIEHCSFLGKFPVFHAQLMVKCFALSLELRKRFKHREGWPGRLRHMF